MDKVLAALAEKNLLPVRILVCPTPQRHLCMTQYQTAFPDARLICGKASGQMPPLTRKRRDLRFHGVIGSTNTGEAVMCSPIVESEGSNSVHNVEQAATWELLQRVFQVGIVDDNRSGEVVLM